jgi:hypothetical protein
MKVRKSDSIPRSLLKFFVFFMVLSLPYDGKSGLFGLSVNDYVPLKEGREWKYSIVDKNGDSIVGIKEKSNTALSPTKINGKDVIPVKNYDEDNKQYTLSFYYVDSLNAILVASQKANDAEPKLENIIFIKGPIKEGSSWKSKEIFFTIVSINDSLTVPAGTFNQCLKIKWSSKYAEIIAWYAPDVGNIKGIIRQKVDERITNKEKIMQLVSFKK